MENGILSLIQIYSSPISRKNMWFNEEHQIGQQITKDEISLLFSSNLSMEKILRILTIIIHLDQNRNEPLRTIIKEIIIDKIKQSQTSFVKFLILFSLSEIYEEWKTLDVTIQKFILQLFPTLQQFIVSKEIQKVNDKLEELIARKVDKEIGKGLCSNDFITQCQNSISTLNNQVSNLEINKLSTSGGTITGSLTVNGSFTNSNLDSIINNLQIEVNKKVNQESGKGLIPNDFTKEYQNTINNINNNISSIKQSISNLESTKLSRSGGTITGSLTVTGSFTNSNLNSIINNKVNKEPGKGLSSNDFTYTLKNKLSNISTIDNLSSFSSNAVLSANQGRILYNHINDLKKIYQAIDVKATSLISEGTDLNNITEIGTYGFPNTEKISTIINKPNNLDNAFKLIVSDPCCVFPPGFICQEVFHWWTGKRYYRAYHPTDKKWSQWNE